MFRYGSDRGENVAEVEKKEKIGQLTFITIFLCIFANVKIEIAIRYFADYVATEKRLAASTRRYYVGEVERFGRYLSSQGVEEVEAVEAYHVREWQMSLMAEGEAVGTVTKQLAALRAWFKYLRRQGFCDRDVMAKIASPKAPKRLPVFFRENEVERI